MASNLNVQVNSVLQVIENSSSTAIVNFNFSPTALGATASFFDAYFQVPTTGATPSLPSATVYWFLVVNKDATANITLAFTPTGGSSETVVLTPGGFLMYGLNSESAGGITAMTLTSSAGTISALVLLAA